MEFIVESLNLDSERQIKEVKSFLKDNFDIEYKDDIDYTAVIRNSDYDIIATASKDKNVFKYFGICKDYQGENFSGKLIDALIKKSFEEGIYHYFIFTKPENINIFKGSGFTLIAQNEYAALLEAGNGNINKFIEKLKEKVLDTKGKIGAIVMNLNPFTLGHRYLIEKAASKVDKLLVFIVEEDSSVFPFKDRIKLAEEGTKDLKNVIVLPSGPYLISRATFPTYFMKQKDKMLEAYTKLDADIFKKYYAENLNIRERFVGEEPLDPITNQYNISLKEILEKDGIHLEVIKRKEADGEVISASRVRKYLKENNFESLKRLLPEVTIKYLKSEKAKEIINKIKNS